MPQNGNDKVCIFIMLQSISPRFFTEKQLIEENKIMGRSRGEALPLRLKLRGGQHSSTSSMVRPLMRISTCRPTLGIITVINT